MLTLFAVPKPFRGHIGLIQRNAIMSWTLLRPKCEIILLGDEEGTNEIAREFGLVHIPDVEKSDSNTPLVNSIFQLAEKHASNKLLCYVNCDIILLSDFMNVVGKVYVLNKPFLVIGRRWDVDITGFGDLGKEGWEKSLKEYVLLYGRLQEPPGMDYFIFSRGLWRNIPPFIVGRFYWDNWLVYMACTNGALLIDASREAFVVHQKHDYKFASGHVDKNVGNPEIKYNLNLLDDSSICLSGFYDATYLLTSNGLKRPYSKEHILRRLELFPIIGMKNKTIRSFLMKYISIFTNIMRNPNQVLQKRIERLIVWIQSK
jgi:hypothetical protein